MRKADPSKTAKTAGVSRRVGRPVGTNSTRTILLAAKRLFLASGFEGVNLEQVGQEAGVTRQTVYNLFGSKEAVFRAMVELHWDAIAKDSKTVLSADLDVTLGPSAVLHDFGETIVRFIDETEQIAFTRLVISESHQRAWIAEDLYRLGKRPLLDSFVVCLRRLDEAGSIVCAHPLIAAHQFFGMIQEMIIWPHVMAIGPAVDDLPPARIVVEEAVLTFLSRYGVVDTSQNGTSDAGAARAGGRKRQPLRA